MHRFRVATGGLALTLALTLGSGACAGPTACGPGPPPVHVELAGPNLPAGAVLTVCAGAAGCSTTSAPDGRFRMLSQFPRRLDARELDGAVATARSGTRSARATMRFHDGGTGPCAYSSTSATLRLGPGQAQVLAPEATMGPASGE